MLATHVAEMLGSKINAVNKAMQADHAFARTRHPLGQHALDRELADAMAEARVVGFGDRQLSILQRHAAHFARRRDEAEAEQERLRKETFDAAHTYRHGQLVEAARTAAAVKRTAPARLALDTLRQRLDAIMPALSAAHDDGLYLACLGDLESALTSIGVSIGIERKAATIRQKQAHAAAAVDAAIAA